MDSEIKCMQTWTEEMSDTKVKNSYLKKKQYTKKSKRGQILITVRYNFHSLLALTMTLMCTPKHC